MIYEKQRINKYEEPRFKCILNTWFLRTKFIAQYFDGLRRKQTISKIILTLRACKNI